MPEPRKKPSVRKPAARKPRVRRSKLDPDVRPQRRRPTPAYATLTVRRSPLDPDVRPPLLPRIDRGQRIIPLPRTRRAPPRTPKALIPPSLLERLKDAFGMEEAPPLRMAPLRRAPPLGPRSAPPSLPGRGAPPKVHPPRSRRAPSSPSEPSTPAQKKKADLLRQLERGSRAAPPKATRRVAPKRRAPSRQASPLSRRKKR